MSTSFLPIVSILGAEKIYFVATSNHYLLKSISNSPWVEKVQESMLVISDSHWRNSRVEFKAQVANKNGEFDVNSGEDLTAEQDWKSEMEAEAADCMSALSHLRMSGQTHHVTIGLSCSNSDCTEASVDVSENSDDNGGKQQQKEEEKKEKVEEKEEEKEEEEATRSAAEEHISIDLVKGRMKVGVRQFFHVQTIVDAIKAFLHGLTESDAAVMAAVERDFPCLLDVMGRMFFLDKIVFFGANTNTIDIMAPFDMPSLKIVYPKLHELFTRWLGDVKVEILHENRRDLAVMVCYDARRCTGIVKLKKNNEGDILWTREESTVDMTEVDENDDEDTAAAVVNKDDKVSFGMGRPMIVRLNIRAALFGYSFLGFQLPTTELTCESQPDGHAAIHLSSLTGWTVGLANSFLGKDLIGTVMDSLHCNVAIVAGRDDQVPLINKHAPHFTVSDAELALSLSVASPRKSIVAYIVRAAWVQFVKKGTLFAVWNMFSDLLGAVASDVAAIIQMQDEQEQHQ